MDRDFLRAYSLRLIETCHKRRAHAMGGMAAQIPVKNDEAANAVAFAKVAVDKRREASQGHDGTWVAHPALVPVAMEVFDDIMKSKHQIHKKQQNARISDEDMLSPHQGTITEAGVRTNIEVGIRYIAAWLTGSGAVPIHNLMEDAATAEISRTQIWQWLRHAASIEMADGSSQRFTSDMYRSLLAEEVEAIKAELGADSFTAARFPEAVTIFTQTATSADLPEFLTLPAYAILED